MSDEGLGVAGAKDFFKAVGMKALRKRHIPHPWHDRNRKMEKIVLFYSGQVKQRLRRKDAGHDSAHKIKELNVNSDERKCGHINRRVEKADILLKNLDKNIDLRPLIKMYLDNGLKRKVDGSRKLQDTSV